VAISEKVKLLLLLLYSDICNAEFIVFSTVFSGDGKRYTSSGNMEIGAMVLPWPVY